MTGRAFVDSNILIYTIDSRAGSKRDVARARVEQLWDSGLGCISTQVLQEFYNTVVRKLQPALPREEAAALVQDYARWDLVVVDAHTIVRAAGIEARYRLSFWDALIVAAAARSGAETLLTEDLSHGQDVEGIRIENPFLS